MEEQDLEIMKSSFKEQKIWEKRISQTKTKSRDWTSILGVFYVSKMVSYNPLR